MSADSLLTVLPQANGLAGLERAGLYAPSLQPEPFPVRRIKPAPCTQACPAGIQVKAYVSLIAEERFAEALEVIRRRCPLPGICGRVCDHPCELACRRGRTDEPIAIRALKRFVADQERDFPLPAPPPTMSADASVAVIGSGPAGLTAAYDLRLQGFPVTVFEAEAEPGGMLLHGITAYRLPRDILRAEIEVLTRAGVEIRTGLRLGEHITLDELPGRGFRAVLLAVGAQQGRRMGLPGEEELRRIEDALAFLRRVNAGDRTPPGKRVLVIGGGSTAVEAARAARRLGAAFVQVLYRRSEDELLASREEVEAAQREGVRFQFLTAPIGVLATGRRLRGLQCAQVGLGEADAGGRRRPIVIPGTEFRVPADRVLAAVGQEVDLAFLPSRARSGLLEGKALAVDAETSLTRLGGVFAAGDMVSGPATVIEAIASGHRAAESIRHFLKEGRAAIREDRPERRAAPEYELPDVPPMEAQRLHPAMMSPEPGREFAEVEQAFTVRQAVAEARRCIRCGPCGECKICAKTCQRRHILVREQGGDAPGATALLRVPAGVALSLDADRPAPAQLLPQVRPQAPEPGEGMEVELLPLRSWIRQERCRGCAACMEVCSFEAISMVNGAGSEQLARIDPALCRGCNLCNGVCPVSAATPSSLSPEWWGRRIRDALPREAAARARRESCVVLACQRRAGALEAALRRGGVHLEVVRFRCVGQLDAGMFLDLHNADPDCRVLVAGCHPDRCRFDAGAALAGEQVQLANLLLERMGRGHPIRTDWSPARAFDRLEGPIARFLDGAPPPEPPGGRRG